MHIELKTDQMQSIYEYFETEAQLFKAAAICKAGCAFCCIHFGNVDITTLEGVRIHAWIEELAPAAKTAIRQKIAANMQKKTKNAAARCPFLNQDNTCRIYEIRPFSCRQLYSLRECTDRGPTVHRQAVELARKTVQKLQRLDTTGYSGHISYIVHLINKPEFRKIYLAGGYDPAKIMSFGKKHGIIINRMASDLK